MTVMGKGNGHYGKLKTRASSKSVPHAHFHAQLYMNIESVHKDTNTHSRRDLKPLACSIIMKNNTFFFFLVINTITQTYSTKKGKHSNNILNVIAVIVNFATRSAPPHTNSNQIYTSKIKYNNRKI
jgi:hypothetical protein